MQSLLLCRQEFGNSTDKDTILTPQEAENLLTQWVLNPKLQLHSKQVAQLMKVWAQEQENLNELEIQKWYQAGLLHDADWDQWPDLHCKKIIEHLESLHVSPDILHAIASHSPRYFGVEPVSNIDKMLYVFDELSGLIHAYSLMRGGYEGMDVKGVKKKLKNKMFAAGVDREDINDAINKSGQNLEEIIQFIITVQSKNQ